MHTLSSGLRTIAGQPVLGGKRHVSCRDSPTPGLLVSMQLWHTLRGCRLPLGPRVIDRQRQVKTNAAADVSTAEGHKLAIYDVDPMLVDHAPHIDYRWQQYTATKEAIEAAEGSLLEFAQGYKKFGFIVESDAVVYREWAPGAANAQLIGDFNGWNGTEGQMTRDKFGVWEIRIPHGADGKPTIPHGSLVKIKLFNHEGWSVDRLPAWITWATVKPGVMGAKYDGVFWNPPPAEKHVWRHSRPPKPQSLRVYEAHVGMSADEGKVATYTEFKDVVLPRIKDLGYNAVQLMAIQEHAYYASFGYHVTNPFAVSSRSGTPEELKALVDEAHRLGIYVLLDVVHSHISSNVDDGLAGFDFGQPEESNYFRQGPAGYHAQWDSRILNYKNWEVLRYLLSNVRWWLDEYKFDGFRFDGVTSMLYHHHGINVGFSGDYHEYFSTSTDVDAVVYLMLANTVIHSLVPDAVSIAEDVSGMPTLCRPVEEGGVGFDYRLGMAIPDRWIQLLKHVPDEQWSMMDIVSTLCNRRYNEKTIAYAESHDQALVGDQTVAFRLMGAEMYENMSALMEETPVIERGIALHKMIRAVTMALGGEGWLNFMGNEFGHPEWIDFPRDGNDWSYTYCRRQWKLADTDHLRYKFLHAFDKALMELDEKYKFLTSDHFLVSHIGDASAGDQTLVAEKGGLVFVFNFSPSTDLEGFKVGVPEAGKWECIMDSDEWRFGGKGRIGHAVEHFTTPEGIPGVPETNFNNRAHSMMVASPARTVAVYARIPEPHETPYGSGSAFVGRSDVGNGSNGGGDSWNTAPGGGNAGGGYDDDRWSQWTRNPSEWSSTPTGAPSTTPPPARAPTGPPSADPWNRPGSAGYGGAGGRGGRGGGGGGGRPPMARAAGWGEQSVGGGQVETQQQTIMRAPQEHHQQQTPTPWDTPKPWDAPAPWDTAGSWEAAKSWDGPSFWDDAPPALQQQQSQEQAQAQSWMDVMSPQRERGQEEQHTETHWWHQQQQEHQQREEEEGRGWERGAQERGAQGGSSWMDAGPGVWDDPRVAAIQQEMRAQQQEQHTHQHQEQQQQQGGVSSWEAAPGFWDDPRSAAVQQQQQYEQGGGYGTGGGYSTAGEESTGDGDFWPQWKNPYA